LKITAELVIINALLELEKNVVKLHVELRSLFEQHGELVLHNDGFVDALEVLALRWVVANLADNLIEGSLVSNNHLSDFLLLLFKSFILSEVINKLLFLRLKHGHLVSLSLIDLHQFFDGVKVIVHCNSVFLNTFLLKFDLVELLQGSFDSHDRRVLFSLRCLWVLWNGTSKFLASLTK